MTALRNKDFTPTGLRIEGPYENDRNADSKKLFKDILREVYGNGADMDVIIGHHIIYVQRETRPDGFTYEVVQEVPSADALIFCHDVARKLWGDGFKSVLTQLATEPETSRDDLLATLYYGRGKGKPGSEQIIDAWKLVQQNTPAPAH